MDHPLKRLSRREPLTKRYPMTTDHEDQCDLNTVAPESALEQFLQAVEKKTSNPVHHRLLKACRQADPPGALEEELRTIVAEIISET